MAVVLGASRGPSRLGTCYAFLVGIAPQRRGTFYANIRIPIHQRGMRQGSDFESIAWTVATWDMFCVFVGMVPQRRGLCYGGACVSATVAWEVLWQKFAVHREGRCNFGNDTCN